MHTEARGGRAVSGGAACGALPHTCAYSQSHSCRVSSRTACAQSCGTSRHSWQRSHCTHSSHPGTCWGTARGGSRSQGNGAGGRFGTLRRCAQHSCTAAGSSCLPGDCGQREAADPASRHRTRFGRGNRTPQSRVLGAISRRAKSTVVLTSACLRPSRQVHHQLAANLERGRPSFCAIHLHGPRRHAAIVALRIAGVLAPLSSAAAALRHRARSGSWRRRRHRCRACRALLLPAAAHTGATTLHKFLSARMAGATCRPQPRTGP